MQNQRRRLLSERILTSGRRTAGKSTNVATSSNCSSHAEHSGAARCDRSGSCECKFHFQPLSTTQVESAGRTGSSSTVADSGRPQGTSANISKLGNYMKQLSDLSQSDPEKFEDVTSSIARQLKHSADTATQSGDTDAATMLSDLANKFQTASENGARPDLSRDSSDSIAGPRGPAPMGPPPMARR